MQWRRCVRGRPRIVSAILEMEFDRRPSTLAYMLRACYPSAGLRETGGFPPIRVRWRQHRVDRRQLALFLQLTGLHADQTLPMLYPQVFGFPVLMVILTHPAFPIPIWNSLQIRNHLLQHHAIATDTLKDLYFPR